ncbi:MAG: hypothetical protein MMC23_004161 [Stictis urceolatum]|nr:hypothetical protein [Stictis urceolata]
MFSKLQQITNTGKRSAAHNHDQAQVREREGLEQEEEQSSDKAHFSPIEPQNPQPSHISSTPPILPPIPRVASQYVSSGPTTLSEFEKRFRNPAQAENGSQQPAALQIAKSRTPDLPLRRDEPDMRTNSYARPSSENNNFSRPLQAPPKSTARPQTLAGQSRAHADPTAAVPGAKPPSFPRPPSPEARSNRPVRGTPRPPSQLRESFTAEPPVPEVASMVPPPPPWEPPLPPQSTSRAESSASTQQSIRPSSSSGSSSATLMTPTTTVHPSKTSKPMLNRLNPMSFLGRRRSAQPESPVVDAAAQKRNLLSSGSSLPADYDPRIRGKGVHDFSAPRPKRFVSSQDLRPTTTSRLQSGQNQDHDAEGNAKDFKSRAVEADRQHTPVFKEHFGEEIDGVWRYDENDPRNKVTTKILDRMPAEDLEKQSPLPPFAHRFGNETPKAPPIPPAPKSAPLLPTNDQDLGRLTDRPLVQAQPSQPMPNSPESKKSPSTSLPIEPDQSHSASQTRSPSRPQEFGVLETRKQSPDIRIIEADRSPRKSESDLVSFDDTGFQPAGLPKHLQSNASRFSFDLAGVGSAAQEKLLEDKHRQRQARRARSSTVSGDSIAETNDESDYDDMDCDDGMEEQIPGINTDDDEFQGFSGVSDSTFAPNVGASVHSSGLGALSNSWNMSQPLQLQPDALGVYQIPPVSNQDLSTAIATSTAPVVMTQNAHKDPDGVSEAARGRLDSYEDEDDDLYFDDGDIDTGQPEGPNFDESVFDDENSRVYGIALRDQRPAAANTDLTCDSSQQSTRPISSESGAAAVNQARATADTSRTSVQPQEIFLPAPKPSVVGRQNETVQFNESAGLTHDNLAAYHDALALAANQAASEGRFDRKPSIDSVAQNLEHGELPRVSFNDQELGARMRPLSNDSGFKFDDEDDIDDDEFVAAANAEALENDDEGFYGQEFGFYARAFDATEADYINGGYFGPGAERPKRSHSGRAGGQDPSLTPITERSEWSQRNSMISLAHGGSYPHGLQGQGQGQGLVQLADALQHEEQDDMSLSALLKLRRGAWGSATSLHSNTGSQNGGSSPVHSFSSPPLGTGSSGVQHGGGAASIAGANFSLSSPTGNVTSPSEASISASLISPILRVNTQDIVLSPTHGISSGSDTSPKRRNATNKGHSRNSSGAESVSYFKENHEDGSGRWVVEKRRTGEGGQIEVLGRQVVDGGRI